jgi:hypothetical protein
MSGPLRVVGVDDVALHVFVDLDAAELLGWVG